MRSNNQYLFVLPLLVLMAWSCKDSIQGDVPGQVQQIQIDEIVSDIEDGVYGETHSLLVYHDGEILTENYFEPFDATQVHYQYSVTKSITSALIGIAIDQGLIQSVDQKLLDFFPEYDDIKHLDERKKAITLKDVLTMRTGLVWDEWTHPYGDERNDTYDLIASSDMVKHMLDLPMNAAPGTRFTYNSGATMLLSGIIENVSGRSTESFAEEFLFTPLGIRDWKWEQGFNDNLTNTGWGLHLLPQDMLRIGRLFLDNGRWKERQVVSKEWIEESTQNYGNRYGYQWWHYGPDSTYSARGWGGQFIFVNTERNLVLVTTAGNFQDSNGAGQRLAERIMGIL